MPNIGQLAGVPNGVVAMFGNPQMCSAKSHVCRRGLVSKRSIFYGGGGWETPEFALGDSTNQDLYWQTSAEMWQVSVCPVKVLVNMA